MTEETVLDLASVTKAVATATSVVQLVDRDESNLDDSLREFYCDVPEGEYDITIEHLLTRTSGYPAWVPLWTEVDEPGQTIEYILRDTRSTPNREPKSPLAVSATSCLATSFGE